MELLEGRTLRDVLAKEPRSTRRDRVVNDADFRCGGGGPRGGNHSPRFEAREYNLLCNALTSPRWSKFWILVSQN